MAAIASAAVAEALDRLVTLDLSGRGIEGLYQAAREKVGGRLAWAAGERLAAVPSRSFVIIGTGWLSRGWVSPRLGDSDGPPGAAALARALAYGLDVIPVLLTEESLLPAVEPVLRMAGPSILDLEEARRTWLPGGKTPALVLRAFPTDDAEAGPAAERLLDMLQPSLCFATERASRAESGVYHNARGVDISADCARVDLLFEAAARRGVLTIGVGDGGNEIGMGLIPEAVRQVRYGDRCNCGCGAGIGARTATDILIPAGCSNWGCYAVVAALAIQLENTALLHTAAQEEALLRAGVTAGLLNSPSGTVDPNADDIPLPTHLAMTELLHELGVRAIGGCSRRPDMRDGSSLPS